jgi:hypothetical protein
MSVRDVNRPTLIFMTLRRKSIKRVWIADMRRKLNDGFTYFWFI